MKSTRKKYPVNIYDLNSEHKLKERTLLTYLQDIATVNADEIGFGYDWLCPNHYGWFLLKYRIELTQYPKNMDYIEIESYSRGAAKLFAFRDFIIYSPDNEIIGKVASCWSLIDMQTKSMLPIQKCTELMQAFEKKDDDLAFNKIQIPESFTNEKEFEVRYDELDVNGHANNTNYITWALEALPIDFRTKYDIQNVDMQFKKEIKYGEKFISKVFIDEELKQSVHILQKKETQEDMCNICINWQ